MVVFRRMSSPVFSRSLPLVPFLAADGALLLTAALIAWRTPDALTGGALFGVIFCMGLGAVLAVVPFLVNDAREREAELAKRQQELTELVNTTTATSARWGTQWAAAALGLDDAARLTGRSLAAAEGLPAVFQEKADALVARLADVERAAQTRLAAGERQETALAERIGQIAGATAGLQETLGEFGRVEAGLREQRAAIAAVLADFPAAAGQAKAVRAELDERLAAVPVRLDEQLARVVTEAETRLGATTDALMQRLAQMETALDSLTEQLRKTTEVAAEIKPAPAMTEPDVTVEPPAEIAAAPVAAPVPAAVITPEPAPEPMPEPAPEPVVAEVKPVARPETIMDPFLIPDDGYAALAEAMDLDRA
jgi:hypothetical protein